MFYFQTNTLGFTPEFLGRVRLAGALASLAGVAVYNFGLKEVPLRKMFLWTSLLGATLGMTQVLLITGARAPLLTDPLWPHASSPCAGCPAGRSVQCVCSMLAMTLMVQSLCDGRGPDEQRASAALPLEPARCPAWLQQCARLCAHAAAARCVGASHELPLLLLQARAARWACPTSCLCWGTRSC